MGTVRGKQAGVSAAAVNMNALDINSLLASVDPYSLSQRVIRKISIDLSKRHFKDFIYNFWSVVEPSEPIKWNWHLDEFCDICEMAREKKLKRIIVNVPPGTSKSRIFSVFFNAWVWAIDPSKRFLTAAYTPDLTLRDNRDLRDIVRSDRYRDWFGVELSSDQSAKERFQTTAKGWRVATSVGGFATGEHPHFFIIDDPLKSQDATSEAARKNANDWISNTVSTRVALDPVIILVMQRLHEEDPSGFLLDKGGWEHVVFPMRYESRKVDEHDPRNIPHPRDHRTVDGELLWPEKWPEDKIQDEELLLGLGASGQLQQRPVPDGGALYQREWFEIVDAAPVDVEECRGWDIADTDESDPNAKKNDHTSGVKIGIHRKTGIIYIEDSISVQTAFVNDLMLSVAKLDGKMCKIREGSGSGKATIRARTVLLQGFDYAPSPETRAEGDKVTRNNPFRAQAQARNVKLVRGEWNQTWLNVICGFPLIKRDDEVDATSNAANELMSTVGKKKLPSLKGLR